MTVSRFLMKKRNCVVSGSANDDAVYCIRGVGRKKPQPHTGPRRVPARARRYERTAQASPAATIRTAKTATTMLSDWVGIVSDARTWRSGSPLAPATTVASDDTTSGAARPIATHNSARTAIAAHIGPAASCASAASWLRAEPRKTTPKALAKHAAAKPL